MTTSEILIIVCFLSFPAALAGLRGEWHLDSALAAIFGSGVAMGLIIACYALPHLPSTLLF